MKILIKLRSNNEYLKKALLDGIRMDGISYSGMNHIFSQKGLKDIKKLLIKLLEKIIIAFKCICTNQKNLEKKRLENRNFEHLNIKRLCTKCENDDVQQIKKRQFLYKN